MLTAQSDLQPQEKQIIIIPANPLVAQNRTFPRQLRAAAYCRVSTDQEEQLTSYEAQVAYYTDKIMSNPEWTLAGIFADEGITGTSVKKRTNFLRMIRLCRKGKIDIILTKSISRFARNTVDCLNYIRELKELGIAVIFENENINTMKADTEIIITMLAGFAQAQSESISQNVRWGKRQAFKSGKVSFQYSRIYGYERGENDKPRVVPEQAAVVRRIFQSYLAGSSVPDIKRMLEAEGIAAAGGKPQWSVGALQYMLRNEKYCGDALLQKTFVENCISKKTRKNNGELPKYLVQNHHEAIIDRTLFEKVQAEIARRAGKRKVSDKTSKTGQSKYSGRYALTELLICGNCGTPYKRVTWSKRGKKKIVWRCISRLDYGTKYCKSSPTVDEERLQAAVLKAINAMMSNRERLIGILKTNLKITLSEKSSGATNPYAIENRIRELQDSMMELVAVAAKAGNAESYEDKFREISEEIKSLQKTLEQYQAEQNGPDKLARQMDDICKALEDAPFEITEYSNNIVRQFIDTIKVVNEDKLLFIFKGGITMEQPLTI
ncbi:resolvase, n-terminal:recombinase, putative [Heliomicrobium modesticaldum Ice1]|jgi:DNA invertase Pin-like site-specific DNA recombinase|uniref:Resolvase, n-terminal:recombinase, putative n=1 Tax=Heliobacterium modesticaldum (strain ATCC 51547 / Ice1) TaxID=498761 RepID=B0TD52_HELMI|nr:recombinase family protein [Heliomicrobium modesticaldum]ABZ82750.1 resolvase, n-terminal:recombinase, putative [Heliomicrobium modesticaldum Ice1]MCR4431588.1 recombinase family protein [Tepidanaerobacteraceae bacterium]